MVTRAAADLKVMTTVMESPLDLKPQILRDLKEVPTGHQVENFVRISRSDVAYWLKDGKRILRLNGEKASLLKPGGSKELPTRGKFFVIW